MDDDDDCVNDDFSSLSSMSTRSDGNNDGKARFSTAHLWTSAQPLGKLRKRSADSVCTRAQLRGVLLNVEFVDSAKDGSKEVVGGTNCA